MEIDMTDRTDPEALRLAEILEGDYCPDWFYEQGVDEVAAELRRQHARIAEMEAQLEAVGAGGVSGPMMGQPQEMPDLSALTERGAKAWAGVDAQALRAGGADMSKEREAFESWIKKDCGDLSTFGSGAHQHYRNSAVNNAWIAWQARASLAASAGREPVAQPGDVEAILSKICDLLFIGKLARNESTILTNIRNVIDHAGLLHAVERDLFPQPELPEDDDPYAAVDEGLPAPNSWAAKDEADYVAQFRAALAARGFNAQGLRDGVASAGSEPVATIKSWTNGSYWRNYKVEWHRNDLPEGAQLYTHPSPPEGMVGGWIALPGALPEPGVPVLLDIGKKYPIRAMWAAKHTVQACDDDTDWGEYVEEDDMYYAPEGWYEWNQCEDNHWRVTETPRAWMQLPPTSAEGVEHG